VGWVEGFRSVVVDRGLFLLACVLLYVGFCGFFPFFSFFYSGWFFFFWFFVFDFFLVLISFFFFLLVFVGKGTFVFRSAERKTRSIIDTAFILSPSRLFHARIP